MMSRYENEFEDDTDDDEGWEDEAAEDARTMACPYCGAELYPDADLCPECGNFIIDADIQEGHPLWNRSPLWTTLTIAGIIATIVALLGMFLVFH